MPRLWDDTIEAHRTQVRDAILSTAWTLVTEQGLLSVTMSRIAERAGIGRATLYKYFPDVESILHAWHQRHIAGHLAELAELRDRAGDPGERLDVMLSAYARIARRRAGHGVELWAQLHRAPYVDRAQRQLYDLLTETVTEAAAAGAVRDDVAPGELAAYCLNALNAAGTLPSEAAVGRLVAVTRAGLTPR